MTVEENKNSIYKILLITLSVISVVCTAFGSVNYFAVFDIINDELEFHLPSLIDTLILILNLSACILLFVYALKFHGQSKATVLYPITCELLTAAYLLSGMFGKSIDIVDTVVALSFIILIIGSLTCFTDNVYIIKAYIIIAAIIEIVPNVSDILKIFSDILKLNDIPLNLLFSFAEAIGSIALFVGLLIFGLNNEIPPILKPSLAEQIKQLKEMPPDKALELLNELFNQGKLTEEEYRSQRADIISTI